MNRTDIKKGLWFLLLFMLLSISLSIFYTRVVMAPSILLRVDRQFQASTPRIEYLILGDSHGQSSLSPDVLRESFNFSTANGTYIHSYYKLKHILEKDMKGIDAIVLPLDMHSFAPSNLAGPEQSWYWRKYMDYWELSRYRKKFLYYGYEVGRGLLFPYVNQRDAFLQYFFPNKTKRQIIKGFIPSDDTLPSGTGLRDLARKRARHHFPREVFAEQTLLYYFDKIMKLCREHQVRVILIRFPVSQAYYEEVTQLIDAKKIDDMVQYVRRMYPEAYFLDFLDLYFTETEFFSDVDHLNRKGAVEFSRHLQNELDKLHRVSFSGGR